MNYFNRAREKRPRSFHVLVKPNGPICNLECSYCFYLEKALLYPNTTKWTMPPDVLEEFIRQYIEEQEAPVVSFAWQGGEPTLAGLDFYRQVVAYQQRYAQGKRVENALQTNALLFDESWASFLSEHRFLVGVSIDGPRECHDRYRLDRGGRPTFDRVKRAINLLQRYGVEYNTMTVVHRYNGDRPLDTYRFLRDTGSRFMQFIPIVERIAEQPTPAGLSIVPPKYHGPARVAEWSVQPEQYGRFLCTIFEEWVRKDVGRCFIQTFDVALESWTGREPSLCTARVVCGDAMVIEHNGDVYSCDHFVFPEHRLGNVMHESLGEMALSTAQRSFGNSKADLPRQCRECDVLFACNGGCPKHRFVVRDDHEPPVSYLCPAFRLFYRHVDPYMRFMADELSHKRPPANIMSWAKKQARFSFSGKPRRTAPCPCGSGRIYKHCCGRGA
jgi:uncharacterized protein